MLPSDLIGDKLPKEFSAACVKSLASTHSGVFMLVGDNDEVLAIEAAPDSVRDSLLKIVQGGRATGARFFFQNTHAQYAEGAATELRTKYYAEHKKLPKLNAG